MATRLQPEPAALMRERHADHKGRDGLRHDADHLYPTCGRAIEEDLNAEMLFQPGGAAYAGRRRFFECRRGVGHVRSLGAGLMRQTAIYSTGSPAAFHSGNPSWRRLILNPRSRSKATASKASTQ